MIGINCTSCGQFVGSDGRIDVEYDPYFGGYVEYDPYFGGYEAGYSLCRKCLAEEEGKLKKWEEMKRELSRAPGETRTMGG